MKLHSTITTFIIAALYFTAAAGVLGWTVSYLKQQSAALLEQKRVVANDQQQERQYDLVQSEIEATVQERATVESFTLAEENTISMLADLEVLAERKGITLETQNLEINSENFGPGVKHLTLSWQVVGPSRGVEDFLVQLETLPYVSKINRLSIRTEHEAEGEVTNDQLSAAGVLLIMMNEYVE